MACQQYAPASVKTSRMEKAETDASRTGANEKQADVFKQYADGQKRQAIEDAKNSNSQPPTSAKGKVKRVKHLSPLQSSAW